MVVTDTRRANGPDHRCPHQTGGGPGSDCSHHRQIQAFYDELGKSNESKNTSAVLRLIDDDWEAATTRTCGT